MADGHSERIEEERMTKSVSLAEAWKRYVEAEWKALGKWMDRRRSD